MRAIPLAVCPRPGAGAEGNPGRAGEDNAPGADALIRVAALLPLHPPARDGKGSSLRSAWPWRVRGQFPFLRAGGRPTARREGGRGWAARVGENVASDALI